MTYTVHIKLLGLDIKYTPMGLHSILLGLDIYTWDYTVYVLLGLDICTWAYTVCIVLGLDIYTWSSTQFTDRPRYRIQR